jgi:N-succinyldiaminopimelate aminotransferase
MPARLPYLNSRLQGLGTTVFATMSALAQETGSVNLGQGFPDYDAPAAVLQAATAALAAGHNQYPPGRGISQLRQAIAEHQRRCYGLEYDPDREVLVTMGATEALAASILSLCEVGDEIVVFEPYYDGYPALAAMTGANVRVVRLRQPDWNFDSEELSRSISARTRLVLVNTPHNPTGKVFNDDELAMVASLCVKHDLIAVTDEVYEHLVFEGRHRPLATFAGMRDRTITISSAAKTFSVTGWKIGWACASSPLLEAVLTAKQFLTYAGGTPFQHAVAVGLELGDSVTEPVRSDLQNRRDRLCDGLRQLGFNVQAPASGYFALCEIPESWPDADSFCTEAPTRWGVVAIPAGVFFADRSRAARLVRWAFCKKRSTLEEALRRLAPIASGARAGPQNLE